MELSKKYFLSIQSEVIDGRIFLSGKVDEPEEKIRITKMAWETKGVRSVKNAISIKGDTGFSANLYNYFLLCLDDYNQNHLNDGLITIANKDTSIPLPSYANRTDFQCDPTTGEKIYNINSNSGFN